MAGGRLWVSRRRLLFSLVSSLLSSLLSPVFIDSHWSFFLFTLLFSFLEGNEGNKRTQQSNTRGVVVHGNKQKRLRDWGWSCCVKDGRLIFNFLSPFLLHFFLFFISWALNWLVIISSQLWGEQIPIVLCRPSEGGVRAGSTFSIFFFLFLDGSGCWTEKCVNSFSICVCLSLSLLRGSREFVLSFFFFLQNFLQSWAQEYFVEGGNKFSAGVVLWKC